MADIARPTRQELAAEFRDVVRDLPALVTAPLYRRWHLRWGATPAEVAGSMPGDALLPRAQFRATLLGVLLMEFGDFAMLRRMLRGIKARAESLARDASRTGRSL